MAGARDRLDQKGFAVQHRRHGPIDEQDAPDPVPLEVGGDQQDRNGDNRWEASVSRFGFLSETL